MIGDSTDEQPVQVPQQGLCSYPDIVAALENVETSQSGGAICCEAEYIQ